MEINLEDAIVILDEAHNIEDAAREAGGFEVADDDLNMAVLQFKNMADHLVLPDSSSRLYQVRLVITSITQSTVRIKKARMIIAFFILLTSSIS